MFTWDQTYRCVIILLKAKIIQQTTFGTSGSLSSPRPCHQNYKIRESKLLKIQQTSLSFSLQLHLHIYEIHYNPFIIVDKRSNKITRKLPTNPILYIDFNKKMIKLDPGVDKVKPKEWYRFCILIMGLQVLIIMLSLIKVDSLMLFFKLSILNFFFMMDGYEVTF